MRSCKLVSLLFIVATITICRAQPQDITDHHAVFHPSSSSQIHERQILPTPNIMLAGTSSVTSDADESIIGDATNDNQFTDLSEGTTDIDEDGIPDSALEGVSVEGLEREKVDTENGLPVSFQGENDEAIMDTITGVVDDRDLDGISDIDMNHLDITEGTEQQSDSGSETDEQGTDLNELETEGTDDADLAGLMEEEGDGSDSDTDSGSEGHIDNDEDKEDEGADIDSVEQMARAYNGVISNTPLAPISTSDPQLGLAASSNEEGSDDSEDGTISFTRELPTNSVEGDSAELIVPRWKRKLGKLQSVDVQLVGKIVGQGGFTNGPQVRKSLTILGDANIIVKGPSKFGRLHRFLRHLRRLHRGGRISRRALRRARRIAFRLSRLHRLSLLDVSPKLSLHRIIEKGQHNEFGLLNNEVVKSLILGKHHKRGLELFLGNGKLAFVIEKKIIPATTKVDDVVSDTKDLTLNVAAGGHLKITYHFKKHKEGYKLRLLHKLIKYLRLPSLTRMRLLRLHRFIALHRLERKLMALKIRMLIHAIIACKRFEAMKHNIMSSSNPIIMSSKFDLVRPIGSIGSIGHRFRLAKLIDNIRRSSQPSLSRQYGRHGSLRRGFDSLHRPSSLFRTLRVIDPINRSTRLRSSRFNLAAIKELNIPSVSRRRALLRDSAILDAPEPLLSRARVSPNIVSSRVREQFRSEPITNEALQLVQQHRLSQQQRQQLSASGSDIDTIIDGDDATTTAQ